MEAYHTGIVLFDSHLDRFDIASACKSQFESSDFEVISHRRRYKQESALRLPVLIIEEDQGVNNLWADFCKISTRVGNISSISARCTWSMFHERLQIIRCSYREKVQDQGGAVDTFWKHHRESPYIFSLFANKDSRSHRLQFLVFFSSHKIHMHCTVKPSYAALFNQSTTNTILELINVDI